MLRSCAIQPKSEQARNRLLEPFGLGSGLIPSLSPTDSGVFLFLHTVGSLELALPSPDEDHNVDKIRAIQVNSSALEIARLARRPSGPSTNSKQDGLSPCPA